MSCMVICPFYILLAPVSGLKKYKLFSRLKKTSVNILAIVLFLQLSLIIILEGHVI